MSEDLSAKIETHERAVAIDALGAILPAGRANHLAGVLTDDDVATLRHLTEKGMGANSLRALMSDLGYLEAWACAALGSPLPWPADEAILLKFIAHHLWDEAEKDRNTDHGMPVLVDEDLRARGFLRANGPHAPSTVRRRLSSWATLTAWRDLEGPFNSKSLKKALRLAVRASGRPRTRKSARAVSGDVVGPLLAHLDTVASLWVSQGDRSASAARLCALRDRALISLGFAAGGRRRSELAALYRRQLSFHEIVEHATSGTDGTIIPALRLKLGRTKTGSADDGSEILVVGRAAKDVEAWLKAARVTDGPVFRSISRWGVVSEQGLSGKSVSTALKRRIAQIGLDPEEFSAHGLRSGYLTEAALQGVSLPEAMQQSGHRSVQQASSYFNAAQNASSRNARLLP